MKAYKRKPMGRWQSHPAVAIAETPVSLSQCGIITHGSSKTSYIIGSTGGLFGNDIRYFVELDEADLRNALTAWSHNEEFRQIVKEIMG